MPDLTPESIAEAAQMPAKGAANGQSAEAHPLPDQIKADQYRKAAASAGQTNAQGGRRSGWRGVVSGRAIPPGAT